MELNNSCFPSLVENVKFLFFFLNYVFIKCITFFMLSFILGSFILNLLFHEFINLWRQVESNVNKLLSHASQIRSTAFLLEGFKVIKALSQVLDLLIPLAPLPVDFLPDSIDIANFICEEEIITESLHEMVNLHIAPLSEDLDPVLDLVLFL